MDPSGKNENRQDREIPPRSIDSGNLSSSEARLKDQPFDLASHVKFFEKQNPQMTDEEAKYRLLYELSIS
jgi:hypothetical protein